MLGLVTVVDWLDRHVMQVVAVCRAVMHAESCVLVHVPLYAQGHTVEHSVEHAVGNTVAACAEETIAMSIARMMNALAACSARPRGSGRRGVRDGTMAGRRGAG